jgi:hypothetical protein
MRLWGATALLLVGCFSPYVFTATSGSASSAIPRPPEHVAVYTAGPPQRPYHEIGVIEARETANDWGTQGLIRQLRNGAGRRGCDGVVVTSLRQEVGYGLGTCIVYKDGANRASE